MRCLKDNMVCLMAVCVIMALVCFPVEAGKPTGETNCTDGIDNDGDGKIDCPDPDCKKDPACQQDTDPAGNCLMTFMAELSPSPDIVTSDYATTACGTNGEYCNGVDKVLLRASDASFKFNTQWPKPRNRDVHRTAHLDLSSFDNLGNCAGSPCDLGDGYKTIEMWFRTPPGGLDLCALCWGADCQSGPSSPGAQDGCFMGGEGFWDDPRDACGPDEVSSQGKVGLFIVFPVEGAIEDRMRLHYAVEYHDTYYCPESQPVVVTRINEDQWTVEGSMAAVKQGYLTHLQEDGQHYFLVQPEQNGSVCARPAPFFLTLTRIE